MNVANASLIMKSFTKGGTLMLTMERHQLILSLLAEKKTVRLQELSDRTNASDSTIRRDLDALEQQGALKRVHGGASSLSASREEAPMSEKTGQYHEQKKIIASLAAGTISKKETIFLDAGSTTTLMIPYLDSSVTVVTNGPEHLPHLAERGITTYVIGGFVKPGTRAIVGANAVENLKQYRFDRCFLGVNGITEEDGLTTPDPEEAAIKKKVLYQSMNRYVLADHSKFGERTFITFAGAEDAILVTDSSGPVVTAMQNNKDIEVMLP